MSTLAVGQERIARESVYPVPLISSILPGRLITEIQKKPECVAREAYEREIGG